MKAVGLVIASAVCLAASASGRAPWGSSGFSLAYERCVNSGDADKGVATAFAKCISEETDRQNVRLDSNYKKTMARLNPKQKETLQTSQRNWFPARSRWCRREVDEMTRGDGKRRPEIYSSCMLGGIAERANWLEKYRG